MLKLALVGAGRWGVNIRQTLATFADVRLAYVVERGWRALLRVPDLDGVIIATPASTHARIAQPFVTRGIPTFIEKPLTSSLRDALALQRAARQSGALVFVGHVHLYNPAYLKAKSLARRAGRLRFLYAEGMNNGPFRDDISALWDWAPHDVAVALDLLGAEPTAVQAWGLKTLRPRTNLHDLAMFRLLFPSGIQVFCTESWLMPEKRKRLTIVGTKNTIVFDDAAERKVTLYRKMGPTVRGAQVRRQEPTVSFPAYSKEPPLKRELAAFLYCLRTGRPPRTNLDHGLATVRILEALERSLRRKGELVTHPTS